MRLFHVSDRSDIRTFLPRTSRGAASSYPFPNYDIVWAIDKRHLPNYLLPRDCPRVCYYPTEATTLRDIDRYVGRNRFRHVIAIEEAWLLRAIKDTIWLYEMPTESFELFDSGAGYYVSRESVEPIACREIRSPLTELERYEVSLRIEEDLSILQEEIVGTSLQFSCIRMRTTRSRLNS